jgi:hypothetical protein
MALSRPISQAQRSPEKPTESPKTTTRARVSLYERLCWLTHGGIADLPNDWSQQFKALGLQRCG